MLEYDDCFINGPTSETSEDEEKIYYSKSCNKQRLQQAAFLSNIFTLYNAAFCLIHVLPLLQVYFQFLVI